MDGTVSDGASVALPPAADDSDLLAEEAAVAALIELHSDANDLVYASEQRGNGDKVDR